MNEFWFTVLVFVFPVAAHAASTDTVLAPAAVSRPRGNPITLFGNPAVIQGPRKGEPAGLRKTVPAEFKEPEVPKPLKKKKKRVPVQPVEKKTEAKPPKRKLVLVSFYDKWEASRELCVWSLGKVFVPVYEPGPARNLDLTWQPEPPKPDRIILYPKKR